MGEWFESDLEPDDDPLLQGIPTNWSGQLAGIIAAAALIAAAAYKMWMWLC